MTTVSTVTLDLDGTLLPDTTAFMEVLRRHGREADVQASDEQYFAGAITLHECFMEQWAWFQELTPADIHRALRQAPWLADMDAGIARLHDAGLAVRMLTDQPSTVTDFGSRWGLEPAICSPVTVKEGRQTAIDFREDKRANLLAAGLDPSMVLHVGNGANDVPVWNAGATGLAVFASPDVAHHAAQDLGRPASLLEVADAALRLLS